MAEIRTRLRIRLDAGYKEQQLAAIACDMPASTFGTFERGYKIPRRETAERIRRVLRYTDEEAEVWLNLKHEPSFIVRNGVVYLSHETFKVKFVCLDADVVSFIRQGMPHATIDGMAMYPEEMCHAWFRRELD